MKDFKRTLLFILIMMVGVAWILFTPQVFEYADAQRTIEGTGSEIFYPFVPLLFCLLIPSDKPINKYDN